MLCSVMAFGQYKGGAGDGFATVKTVVVTQLQEVKNELKVLIEDGKISLKNGVNAEFKLYSVDGKLLQIASNELDVSMFHGVVLYQVKTRANQITTGKIWLE